MRNHLLIVDISSLIFRSFYAISGLTTSKGDPVNALYGVFSMICKLFEKYPEASVVIAWDHPDKNFRHDIYKEYKANRDAPPEDLKFQFPLIRELVEVMKLPHVRVRGVEADDLIATLVKVFKSEFEKVFIVSGDKDLMQLVDDQVNLLDTKMEKIYGPTEVHKKFGVYPKHVLDYLSLIGDTSDNVPGVKGIGPKSAQKLIGKYETLEEIYANIDDIDNNRAQKALKNSRELAFLSKKLITMKDDVSMDIELEHFDQKFAPTKDLVDFLKKYELRSHVKRLEKQFGLEKSTSIKEKTVIKKTRNHHFKLECISSVEDLNLKVEELCENEKIFWIPIYNYSENNELNMHSLYLGDMSGNFYSVNFKLENLNPELHIISKIWKSRRVKIVCYDSKRDIKYLRKNYEHLSFFSYFDLSLAVFLCVGKGKINFGDSLKLYGDYYGEVEELFLKEIDNGAEEAITEKNSYITKLEASFKHLIDFYEAVKLDLKTKKLIKFYRNIENPIVNILIEMERIGISIDEKYFESLSQTFKSELSEINKEIKSLIDDEVNLNSPKQVSKLLFDDLSLPVIKKTKTGFSTDAEVLSTLDKMGLSPVPRLIIRHRELEKLISTYVHALPQLVDPKDHRIHTHLNLKVTATGRLSSDAPNLQNIPVRTEAGKLVRKGFVAPKGKILLSADYSQVELRLLAHFAKDPIMLKALREERDVHVETASEVLGVPYGEVTTLMRSQAKTINYGLMYGQSAFGLSKVLNISRKEAQDYINQYFVKFGKVKAYLDSLVEKCAENGYAETLFGRKRYLPDINSKNRTVKAMAERLAINTPIQGTAAEIIKLAMLKISDTLKLNKMRTVLILQVHDELIFEAPTDELEVLKKFVKEAMEEVTPLRVPLCVDIGYGKNWMELKSTT